MRTSRLILLAVLYEMQRSPRCATCGTAFDERNPQTAGHQPPLARLALDATLDGQRVPLVVISQCHRCNMTQGTRTIDEWRRGEHARPRPDAALLEAYSRADYRVKQARRSLGIWRPSATHRAAIASATASLRTAETKRVLHLRGWRPVFAPHQERIAELRHAIVRHEESLARSLVAEALVGEAEAALGTLGTHPPSRADIPKNSITDWLVPNAVAHSSEPRPLPGQRKAETEQRRRERERAQRERERMVTRDAARRAEGRCLACGRSLERVPGRPGRPSLRCDRCRQAGT